MPVGNSLQEQLLKAGLVDQQRVQQADKTKRQKHKAERHAGQKQENLAAQRAKQSMAREAERNRELNRQKNATAKRRETRAQVRQLIEQHRLTDAAGDIAFHFNDQGKIKRLYVTKEQQVRLGSGRLAIAKFKSKYDIVPPDIAEKIRQRDANYLVDLDNQRSPSDSDDAYAAYQVPDDLIW